MKSKRFQNLLTSLPEASASLNFILLLRCHLSGELKKFLFDGRGYAQRDCRWFGEIKN
jgi:hypothetical protein